ncbi:ABC transporter ATP-binding protein [cyanobiont of Ornithocercus magnificus]|nr:ABC transporter ATP-binding protein [cyanobiont of Ornithocercus magnificus]
MQEIVAQLTNISKTYGSGSATVQALNCLNLTVERGEYLAVMGASGSGKSTAMNILGCLDRPSSGNYQLNGKAVEKLSDDQLADLRNCDLGFVFQQFHLLTYATAMENVMLPMIYAGFTPAEQRQQAEEALCRVGLADRLNNKPNQLSGGQQQRVAIARAIINQPALLLADEPTGALDSRTTEDVLCLFDELHQQGITIILVTHEDEVAACASRVVHFLDGQLMSTEEQELGQSSRISGKRKHINTKSQTKNWI